MKKRIGTIVSLSFLTALSAAAAVSSSFAWFTYQATLNNNQLVTGSSIGAYFGGGDGSAETPYKIITSTHLYNLAWLQYLGYFNEDKAKVVDGQEVSGSDGNIDKQYYFTLENDIEMNDMVIPPIGTSKYPFLGNFNGNGHVVKDFTTSNLLGSDHISKKPTIVTKLSDVEIIGFFGVVGALPNTTLNYNSSVNQISNFALDDFTIESTNSSNGNLIGLAAGYVNGNISAIGIGQAKFNLASGITAIANNKIDSQKTTSNISDYSLVGYCTENYVRKTNLVNIEAKEPTVKKGKATSGGTFEGASIPMSDIFAHLHSMRDDAERVKYISSTDRYFDVNGNEEENLRKDTYSDSPNVGSYTNGSYFYEDQANTDSNGQVFESVSFARRYNNGYSDDNFIYISGSDEVTISNNGRTYNDYKYKDLPTIYIYKDSTHYLAINNNHNGITNSTTGTTKWIIDNGRILTIVDGTPYYLTRNGTTGLTVSTTLSNNNLWTNANGVYSIVNGTTVYYLRCNNGTWGLATMPNGTYQSGYLISDGNGNYLSANNNYNGLTNQTSFTNATVWNVDTYVSITNNGNTYYVRSSSQTPSATSLTLSSSTNYRFSKNNNTLRYRRTSWGTTYNYYVYYNGTQWSSTTTSTDLQFDYVARPTTTDATYTLSTSNAGSINYRSGVPDVSTGVASYKTADTFIPLKYKTNHSDVDIGNTGYIVGGSRFFDSTQMISDMRVSRYDTADLKGSFGSNTYSTSTRSNFKVLTKTYKTYNQSKYNSNSNSYFAAIADDFNNGTDDSNVTFKYYDGYGDYASSTNRTYKYARYNSIGLTKYGDARADLDDTWRNGEGSGSYIYGLHFMNASISETEKIAIDKAVINSATYIKESDGYYHHYETTDRVNEDGSFVIDPNTGKPYQDTEDVGYMSGPYEMPKDCIDFNLAENATINFFAGSFFSNNNAFFSLHRIFRKKTTTPATINDETVQLSNANQIDDIKEIHYVYQNTEYSITNREAPRYIYQYTDGKYGYGEEVLESINSELLGQMLFNTDWIKGATGNALNPYSSYYFEIPAVKGEYALGSVDGKTGAYLMYLDIGAADVNDDIVNVTEKVTILTNSYNHPIGVDFCKLPLAEGQTLAAIVEGYHVGTVVVPTGVYGSDISFSLEETTNQQTNVTSRVLTCGPPSSATKLTKSTYIGDNVTMKCNNVAITATESAWTKEVRTISTKHAYSKDEEALVDTIVYASVTTTNTDSTGTTDGYTRTNDPIAMTQTDYETNYKLETNDSTGTNSYVSLSYYVLGETDPTVTCEYKCTHAVDPYLYTYEFTITTTSDIAVHVDSLISSLAEQGVEVYQIKINGTVYVAGNTAIIVANP